MDLHLIDSENGWGSGDYGLIIHTTDGGKTWEKQYSGTEEHLDHIFFINKNEGWISGINGTVLHTTDGGKNWILMDFPFSRYVNGIYFSDVNNGWFWGSNNTLIKYTSGVTDIKSKYETPDKYELFNNYPNPFNDETVIRFKNAEIDYVRLEIYNLLGQRVKTLIKKQLSPGVHKVKWDGTDNNGDKVSSGVYIYRLKTKNFSGFKKMVLLR